MKNVSEFCPWDFFSCRTCGCTDVCFRNTRNEVCECEVLCQLSFFVIRTDCSLKPPLSYPPSHTTAIPVTHHELGMGEGGTAGGGGFYRRVFGRRG